MGKLKKLKNKVRTLEATNANLLFRLERLEKAVAGNQGAKTDIAVDVATKSITEDIERDLFRDPLPTIQGIAKQLDEMEVKAEGISEAIEDAIKDLELQKPKEPQFFDDYGDLNEGPCPSCPPPHQLPPLTYKSEPNDLLFRPKGENMIRDANLAAMDTGYDGNGSEIG